MSAIKSNSNASTSPHPPPPPPSLPPSLPPSPAPTHRHTELYAEQRDTPHAPLLLQDWSSGLPHNITTSKKTGKRLKTSYRQQRNDGASCARQCAASGRARKRGNSCALQRSQCLSRTIYRMQTEKCVRGIHFRPTNDAAARIRRAGFTFHHELRDRAGGDLIRT
jgi:hypothetical protein